MRKASIWTVALVVVGLSTGCKGNFQRSSNDNNGRTGSTGTSGTADVNGGQTLTLRGCVENGVPTGTYVLRATVPAETPGAGTAATSGSNQGSRVTGVYRLIATGNVDFGQNLGKEVAVTGELARQSHDNTVGTTGPAGGRAQGDAADHTAGAKFLRVTSMNKVGDSCEGR